MTDTTFELSKMAVTNGVQGLGIGNAAALSHIRSWIRHSKIILYSNRRLKSTIYLYEILALKKFFLEQVFMNERILKWKNYFMITIIFLFLFLFIKSFKTFTYFLLNHHINNVNIIPRLLQNNSYCLKKKIRGAWEKKAIFLLVFLMGPATKNAVFVLLQTVNSLSFNGHRVMIEAGTGENSVIRTKI
jgi:hypothetical protein